MLHAAAEFGLMFSLTCHDVREIPEFVPDPSHPESTQTKFKDTTTAQKNFIEFLAEQAAALATDDNVDENGFARLEVVTYTGAFDLM